ncbi:MAG: hypothetical protein JWQ46_2917 [Phenylobacterium sp.]|jgi:hypothetical protein|nr:hypothetical protein [Phenylobacterium sp.]MDB5468155.1 hypothetical protein [Phenylobacterium sp.]
MTRLHKPVRHKVRPGASRVRRLDSPSRLRPRAKLVQEDPQPDLSGLILYGQA